MRLVPALRHQISVKNTIPIYSISAARKLGAGTETLIELKVKIKFAI
jgi:hypothetical protein